MLKKNFVEFTKQVSKFTPKTEVYSVGQILEIGDGICYVSGLPEAKYNELLEFPRNTYGLAFNLEEKRVGVIILGDWQYLKEGDEVKTTGQVLSIPVGEELIGRVVDPLVRPLDDKETLEPKARLPIEKIAPGVVKRQSVDTPLQTGIKAIDSMIPIGRGQRELIIGDRKTGKTTITIDTIINQKNEDVICIYVAVGQKTSKVAQIVEKLKEFEALPYTIVVSASASDSASLQYLAPYSGCTIAEYFMEKGKDVLVIYDDLSKHAWAYRQLSLLLKRPSGREAFPGDIFYLHSRLLERACRLSDKHGGGSITALPIIETQAGDVSAYIPTNVISITDGQIYLEPDLFFAGIRPAINAGISVSRVGGDAQIKAMKKVAGKLRLDIAQYTELAAFAQFTTDLDPATKQKVERGSRIREILKQAQDKPMPVSDQVIILWAATGGYLDDIPVSKVRKFEKEFLNFVKEGYPVIAKTIEKTKDLSEKTEEQLKEAIGSFKEIFTKIPNDK